MNLTKRKMINGIVEFVFIVRQSLAEVDGRVSSVSMESHIEIQKNVWKTIKANISHQPNMKWILNEMDEVDKYVEQLIKDGYANKDDWYLIK
jgi:hypothetical protein